MSNKSFASRYDGSPSVRGGSGGGGADLFGIQARRQKDIMALQQAQELERMQKEHDLGAQDTQQKSDVDQKDYAFKAGIDIAKQNGIIPANMPESAIPSDVRNQINALGTAHIALQQKIVNSPDFQDASVKGASALQTKPVLDNNESIMRARQLSTITAQPNTTLNYFPHGNPNEPSATAYGDIQKVTTVGGITDPKTGQVVGGRPVETYTPGRFPVDKVDFGGSNALTNNVQTKPEPTNIVSGNSLFPADNTTSTGMLLNTPPALSTKPTAQPSSPLMTMGPSGPSIDWQKVLQMIKTGSQGPLMMGH
jgi:hypothetical protein